ncbi:hypothetical protein FACS189440_11680 [Bacteroidia bacterium]|nr:hypothetical protein FACS189440_11680 [Bacteroidia bacterium]
MKHTLLITLIVFTNFACSAKAAANPDIELLRKNFIAELIAPPVNETSVRELIASLQPDGSWQDIDYVDTSRLAFQHSKHLDNLIQMCRAYKKKESKWKGNKELKKAISLSLDFWLKHDFIAENWHSNEIRTPQLLTGVLLIMDTGLTKEQIAKASAITFRANIHAEGARPSGDRINIIGIQAKNALYNRDVALFEMLIKEIEGEIKFASDTQRGMQQDYSFHHREDRVNNTLSYGVGYADAFVEWAAKVAGTRYQFSEKSLRQLTDYYLDGICKQKAFGKFAAPATDNRDISNPKRLTGDAHHWAKYGGGLYDIANSKKSTCDAHLAEKLLVATSYRKAELQESIDLCQNDKKPTLSHSTFFWQTEHYVHQRPKYYTTVRMFSSRNKNMEWPYNGEGLMNHHRGDGTSYLTLTGEEYLNLAPVNDWQKIPGTTVLQKPALPPADQIQKAGAMDFVGAVTDGLYGAVGFDFVSPHDASLNARKAWFFFDDEYVCLGAAINAYSVLTAATTLNQCFLNGDVVVSTGGNKQTLTKGEHTLSEPNWVFHDGAGYIFPIPEQVHLSNQAQTGSWSLISRQSHLSKEEVSKDVFKLWVNHTPKPKDNYYQYIDDSYQYIVMPAASQQEVDAASQNPKVDIVNTQNVQAVWHRPLQMLQAVFYKTGKVDVGGLQIEMDEPGIILVKTEGKHIKEISVADPVRKLGKIHLSVNRKLPEKGDNYRSVWNEATGFSEVSVDLPQGLFAGKSVTIKISSKQESMEELINDRLNRSVQHYEQMAKSLINKSGQLPRTIDGEGNLLTTSSSGWVSGYVPGTLWYLYQYSNDPQLLDAAKNYTMRIEKEQYNKSTHDIGLMLYCSFGNGFLITGDTAYRNILLNGAESLASRFNPKTGCIQSWDSNAQWQFPVIIDNMMVLELLFWASKVSGNPRYKDICISHADKTIENHFRSDYSSYHVVSYDTVTGQVEKKNTHQGYADESAWARGQAWGVYGYTVMYRETHDPKYLEQAKHIADFILKHPNLPVDKIPYWDFNAPDIPHALRDASTGAIIASALIELSGYVENSLAKNYLEVAETQLRTLSSPEYFAETGTNGNFILKHSVGHLPVKSEIDVPLTYADYYYIEALLRYRNVKMNNSRIKQ